MKLWTKIVVAVATVGAASSAMAQQATGFTLDADLKPLKIVGDTLTANKADITGVVAMAFTLGLMVFAIGVLFHKFNTRKKMPH